ncbi:hypothetical protein [Aliarcobacter butzleri]|uniref:Phage abortive infection protein n=1 Tax=Aliarcobacter butzleri TaxID=28197 RepID=A0AAW7PS29_9BACT|nr:hypothetical protein [Aliarcobacter butzleri]MDN5063923.1 hypothetical protein [Aliarcobacter butzleri]MDN5065157.1 hypothetical protein [Aliarcobacter butzleri]
MFYISATWILLIVIYALYSWINQSGTNPIGLNEWGDFLAGFFAPLLFAWLVYGVFIQKKEFANALESFQLQHKEMRGQSEQIEIQQLNTWFNRNAKTINMLKTTIMQDVNKSIQQIAVDLEENIINHDNFFEVYDELKNLINIDIYVKEYLLELKKSNDHKTFQKSIDEILNEYEVLFKTDTQYAKRILTLVYFFIFASRKQNETYEKYKIYSKWIINEEDYQNILITYTKTNFEETLKEIMKNYQTFEINFKTGKLYGSI